MAKKHSRSQEESRHHVREILADGIEYDNSLIEVLQDVVKISHHPGADLASLAAYDTDAQLGDYAACLLLFGLRDPEVPEDVLERLTKAARPILENALRDMRIPDDRKLMLGTTYRVCGGEMDEKEYQGCFQNFSATLGKAIKQLHSEISDQPDSIERWLGAAEILNHDGEPPSEDRVEVTMAACAVMGKQNPEAAAATCCTIAAILAEHHLPTEDILPMLESLGEYPNEKAAWYFGELARFPATGELGALAGRMAEQMKSSGISPRCTIIRDFSHAHLSMVDGVGSRSLVLFFRTPEGGMDGVALMINDQVGMKDAWCAFEDSTKIQQAINQQFSDLSYAPISLAQAREFLADAWAIHEQRQTPFPGRFFVYRPYFGEQPIEPRRHTPNKGAYMLEMMMPNASLVQDSEDLVDYGPYGGLRFASDAAYEFVKKNMPKRARRLPKKAMEQFLREIAPLEREPLLSRMAMNLELESMAGRATQQINQIGTKTYLALRDNIVPFAEVPFIRALAEMAVEIIIANIRSGFANQVQANEAGMESDEAMGGILEDLLGGMDGWNERGR